MATWFQRIAPKILPGNKASKGVSVPAGIWLHCPQCKETLYSRELESRLKVCPHCEHHFRLTGKERIKMLFDPDSFVESSSGLRPADPLKFVDSKKYRDRVRDSSTRSGQSESVTCGIAKIKGITVSAAIFNFEFMGGSMGSVAGEKITRTIEEAIEKRLPVLIVSASGGARMQEGTCSLMQMAKTAGALERLHQATLPYISLLTHPTTGGVSASFAMLGDIIISEPSALIGFAGARVIQQTIKQELPKDFQTAEFLLDHGSIDRIVPRKNLRDDLHLLFSYMLP